MKGWYLYSIKNYHWTFSDFSQLLTAFNSSQSWPEFLFHTCNRNSGTIFRRQSCNIYKRRPDINVASVPAWHIKTEWIPVRGRQVLISVQVTSFGRTRSQKPKHTHIWRKKQENGDSAFGLSLLCKSKIP
ncbi:hypothetical protein ILYODFUR_032388 [Ilyodon furcidens]|uniref:4a-hydroxytetrahydrobiopterin dehydratase n=1 Tax=Ilyodon furcidens TaxID=33524 RepID=A0ABV0UZU3_9TELE